MARESQQLATVLAEHCQGVKYDADKCAGSAYVPFVGWIEFHESANDPAVIVNVKQPRRFKGSAESALEFLGALRAAWSDSD